MTKIKSEITAPPGMWTASGFSDEENDRIDTFRDKFFALVMTHTPGFGIWRKDLDGTRLRHQLFSAEFGGGRKPLDLLIYFDPALASLYVQGEEFPLRRGLKTVCGMPLSVFLRARNGAEGRRVSVTGAQGGTQLVWVSKCLEDPTGRSSEELLEETLQTIEAVGEEVLLLRECLE